MRHKDKATAKTANPMHPVAPRQVVLLAFDGVEVLDVAGPASVFAKAAELQPGSYCLTTVSPRGGVVRTNSGLALAQTLALAQWQGDIDTLLVAGGDEPALRAAILEDGVGQWVAAQHPRARRMASVCTGAFALAAAGVLDGMRSTTHWNACELLQQWCPATHVVADRIFVRDGAVWTSAGVTTGMDLALALVEEDCGREVAVRIARNLALLSLRGESQPQISPVLLAQADASKRLRDLLAWMQGHLRDDLSVEALAQRVAMSPRNFARSFVGETGVTPARYVSQARCDHAAALLRQTDWTLDKVAQQSGFASVDALQRGFRQRFGHTATDYRSAHG